jgi:hypothetical protein
MHTPDLDAYLRLAIRSLPDASSTADQLSAIISLIQTAQSALRDDQPDNIDRVDAALTVALGALALVCKQIESSPQEARLAEPS